MTPLTTRYQEHKLDEVMRHFVRGFQLGPQAVYDFEATVDTAKNRVVFKLVVGPRKELPAHALANSL